MKIIIPYKDVDHRPFSSTIISGGIEKAIRNQLEHLPGAEVIEIRGTNYEKTVLVDLINKIKLQKPDLVICHYPNQYFNSLLSDRIDNIPIAWICHHTAGFAPDYEDVIKRMGIFVRKTGNTLWMASEYQHRKWVELGLRAKVSGYIPSSFVEKRFTPQARTIYDAVTIGRCDPAKDPFLLHRINNGITTLVISNKVSNAYCINNKKWASPTINMWDLDHDSVMHHLSYSGVYFSTWSGETFGQTALEALARGVPVILNGNHEGSHASEKFLLDPSFGRVVTGAFLENIIDTLRNSSYERRSHIADGAYEVFNLNWWLSKQMELIK